VIHTSKEKKPEMIEGEKQEELPPTEEKKLVGHEEVMLLEPEKGKELEERMIRLQAEFENYKKRVAKENDMLKDTTVGDVMLKLLPIVDEFEIAISCMGEPEQKEFRHGMELIYSKLLDLLKKEGVTEMKAQDEAFDPYRHDAMRQGPGDEGMIIEVIQKGYMFKGNVLRHAKVVVGKTEGDEE
jgi:molecular chaperone GrpE